MTQRVLVVDDDPVTLEVLGAILDLEDFEVETCPDGDEALRRLAERRYDVLILDVMMPGTDGLEVCRRVRANPPTAELPVILLTAKARDTDREAGLEAGADAYLTKPFSPLELLDILHTLRGRT